MHSVVQSTFFKALAFSLVSSVWQMSLLWFIVVLCFRMFKLTAAQKFNMAFASQVIGFLVFVYSLYYYNANAIVGYNIFYADKWRNYVNALLPYISFIYLLILTYQFSKLLFGYRITQRLRKNNLKKMPAANRIFIQQITALLSLKKNVNIYLSSSIQCPLTIGFFKPIILVPLAAINHLTKEQMEAVLLHEMAHIKRYDYLVNLIQSFIEKVFFFNIFSRMIHDIIEHERENACDDFVLQFRYNAFHYAEALLKLGRLQTSNAFVMAAAGKKESVLLLRIKRLVHHKKECNKYSFKALAYCFFILIIALPLAFFSSKNIDKPHSLTSTANTGFIVTAVNNQEDIKKQPVLTQSSLEFSASGLTAKSIIKQSRKKELEQRQPDLVINNKQVQNYFTDASNTLHSFKQPEVINASGKNIFLNDDSYKNALSYQNFKQLEAMLQASGNSITLTEDPATKDSYKKLITIEAKDAQGNINIYKVIVELYQ